MMKKCDEAVPKKKKNEENVLDVSHLHISRFIQRVVLEVVVNADKQIQDELRVSFPFLRRDDILGALDLDAPNIARQIIRVRRERPRNGSNARQDRRLDAGR
jgi:hypothetical protein